MPDLAPTSWEALSDVGNKGSAQALSADLMARWSQLPTDLLRQPLLKGLGLTNAGKMRKNYFVD